MRTKWVKIVLLAAVLPLLTGCWDARDVEDRDIATVVFVDKTQDGYSFFVEFAKPSPSKDSQGAQEFAFVKSEGSSLVEAREALDRKTDSPIYLGAVNAVVITDNLAYASIEEYMYRLREIHDYRKTVSILTTAESPESFSNIKSEQSGAGMIINSTMKSLVDTGQMFTYDLTDILDALAGSCRCFLLPRIAISDEDIEVSGFSVFHSGKCIGVIPAESGKGVVLLLAKSPKMFYSVPFENDLATVEIRLKKREIKPTYSEGKVRFTVSCGFDAKLNNTSNGTKITDEANKQISEALQKMIMKDVWDAVHTSLQTFQCDYLEFFNAFRIAYPMEYRKMDWHQEYAESEIEIQITANLDATGMLDYVPSNES